LTSGHWLDGITRYVDVCLGCEASSYEIIDFSSAPWLIMWYLRSRRNSPYLTVEGKQSTRLK
jgi:hypothetical protein